MGIRFLCPNGHKLNVKAFQAGRRGICPFCGAKFQIPTESMLPASGQPANHGPPMAADAPTTPIGDRATAFEQKLEAHLQQAEQPGSNEAPAANAAPDPSAELSPTPNAPTKKKPAAGKTAPANQPAEFLPDAPHEKLAAEAPAAPAPPQSPAVPDPLTDMPNAVWYVRPPSGGQFGPAQADMMRTWLKEGRISPETLVWCEGWPDWREAGSVFPQLQSSSAATTAPPVAATGTGNSATSDFRTGARRRKTGPNMGVIIVLSSAVLLLLAILLAILLGFLNSDSPSQDNAVVLNATCASLTTPVPWADPIPLTEPCTFNERTADNGGPASWSQRSDGPFIQYANINRF